MANHENPKKKEKRIQLLRDFSLTCATGRQKKVLRRLELRRLSQYFKYGDSLDSMLGECLVCRINFDHMQQRLLSEGANLSLQKAIDISLSLDSVIKQGAVIQNEFKQPNEAVSIIEPKMCSFTNKFFFFTKIRGTQQKFAEKKKSLLTIKHSNVVSETTLVENSENDLFSIYLLLQISFHQLPYLLPLHVILRR